MPLASRARTVGVRTTQAEARRWRRVAKRDGLRLSEYVRLAVATWTEQRESEQAKEEQPR